MLRLGPFTLIDPFSPWHGSSVVLELGPEGLRNLQSVTEAGLAYISAGWVELLSWTSQPAIRAAEPWGAWAERARRGGFTQVGLSGWTGWHQPEVLTEVRLATQSLPVQVHLYAAWADAEGYLAPLESLAGAGAAGWTLPPLQPFPWDTFRRALPYLRYLGKPLFVLPFWKEAGGEIGVPSSPSLALSGWEGIPAYAESIAIYALGQFGKVYGGPLGVGPITTSEGLAEAQRQQLRAFTAVPYIVKEDTAVATYDPIWKLHPPLRTAADREALWQALRKKELEAIAAWDYAPPAEQKLHPWGEASVGCPTLEVAAPLLWSRLDPAQPLLERLALLVSWLSVAPRRWLGLPPGHFQTGCPLDFTIFRVLEAPQPLPPPWHTHQSTLEVLGIIRSLDDADSLRSRIL
ncbi:MAG: hypothetical protein ABDH91_06980 [Bacteroidia bacterium]